MVYYLSKPKQPYISIHSPPSFLFDLFDFFDFLIYIIHKDVKMSITFLTSLTFKGISIKHFLISLCFKLIFRDIIDKIKYKKSIYTKSKKSRGDLNERIYIKFRHTNKSWQRLRSGKIHQYTSNHFTEKTQKNYLNKQA